MLVGVDLGTQSLKVVVTDEALAVIAEASVPYQPSVPRPGWAEQDPQRWLDALAPALAQTGVDLAGVTAIGVAGQLDGCVPVDAGGAALGPCLIWMDRRATAELPELASFGARTGQVLDPSHLAAKARWLDRHRPGAARFHQPVSFVVEQLCGANVIDHALASTCNVYDLATRAWAPDLLAAFELDEARLPRIAHATDVAGALTAHGAALTGLRAGIPVAVGTGDDFATPLGAGIVAPGRVVCVLGTAEVVGALATTPVIDRGGLVETHAYPAGGWFVENPGWLAGGALAWLGALLGGADARQIDALADQAPAGADGVTFVPALAGAMAPEWNAAARASFTGLTAAHGPPHLARAVLEGCAFAMRDVITRLDELGVATPAIVLLGGGAKSATWARIRADVARRPVERVAGDTCPVGAAMLAAVAGGVASDLASIQLPPPITVAEPASACDDAYARYRAIYTALRPTFD